MTLSWPGITSSLSPSLLLRILGLGELVGSPRWSGCWDSNGCWPWKLINLVCVGKLIFGMFKLTGIFGLIMFPILAVEVGTWWNCVRFADVDKLIADICCCWRRPVVVRVANAPAPSCWVVPDDERVTRLLVDTAAASGWGQTRATGIALSVDVVVVELAINLPDVASDDACCNCAVVTIVDVVP